LTPVGVARLPAAATRKENLMFDPTRPYQPLTSENTALILVDHQVGLMTGVRDYSTGELKHNVVALAKAAKALQLPIIVTTTARDSMWGPTFPELVEALPGVPIIDRSSVNAFDDPKVAEAIMATGRKKLIFAGISLEVCAAFPAITAIGKGLDAYVAVDASGTFSETKRQVGLLRMLQVGVILSDYATLMVEILQDNARSESAGRLRCNGHAVGETRGADRAGLRQVTKCAASRLATIRHKRVASTPIRARRSRSCQSKVATHPGNIMTAPLLRRPVGSCATALRKCSRKSDAPRVIA
jgi:nicotinamidase-related amidase